MIINIKKPLSYLGSVSGRDEDKLSKVNLTTVFEDGIPYFKEAKIAMFCKNLYIQNFEPDCFLDKELDEKFYPDKDYHTLYIAEVKKILIKE